MGEWLEPGCHVTDIGGGLDRTVFDRVDVALRLGTTPAPVGTAHPTSAASRIDMPSGTTVSRFSLMTEYAAKVVIPPAFTFLPFQS